MRIELNQVSKSFRGTPVLENIQITFESGKIYGIVGTNGSGKTMLLRAISGLLVPIEGEILVDGKRLHKDLSFPPEMGILIEKPEFLKHLTGFENLWQLAEIKNKITKEQVKEYMTLFGLEPDSKKVVRKYSLGMRQKLGIIQAIMEDQQVLILDEAFNALDEESVALVQGLLKQYREEGRLIIITSHHREDIESLCDVTYQMIDGRIRS